MPSVEVARHLPELAPPPRRVGGFSLGQEIGRGGMGVVYEATQAARPRRVAVKVLPPSAFSSPRERERFRREAEAAARLRHPNIIRVLDSGEEAGVLWFAMELLDGETLAAWIERERARQGDDARRDSWLRAAALAADLADALHCAHEAGVIHRDVKPANVFVRSDGAPLLLDFGLAHQEDAATLTRSSECIGTPCTMSPEQARGRPVDRRTDIWSLGATLYEMVTLERAFAGSDPIEVLDRVVRSEPLPPRRHDPRVPRDLETIVLRCLEKAPRHRYATARALADDLRRFRAGAPIRARAVPAPVRLLRRPRARRALAALLVALLAAGVVAKAWQDRRREARLLSFYDERRRGQEDAALIEESDDLAARGGYEAARRKLAPILVRDPGHLEARLRDGFLQLQAGNDPARLLPDLDGLLRDAPDLTTVHRLRARVLRALGRAGEARAADAEAARRPPRLGVEHYFASLERKLAGDLPEALRLVDLALESEPQNARYFHHRIHLREALQDWKGALADGQVYVRLAWNRAGAHWHLGRALAKTGDTRAAVATLRRGIELDARSMGALSDLAAAHLKLGEKREALEVLDLAARQGWEWAPLLIKLATLAIEAGDPVRGRTLAEHGLRLEPRAARGLLALGVALRELGDLAGAREALLESARLDPREPLAFYHLGQLHQKEGDPEEALEAYRRATMLDPRHSGAWNNLGLMLRERRDFAGARRAFRAALALDPGRASSRFNLGLVEDQLGAKEAALEAFREAVRLDPGHAWAWFCLGRALEARGDGAGAIDAWRRGLAAGPTRDDLRTLLAIALARRGELGEAARVLEGGAPAAAAGRSAETERAVRGIVEGAARWRESLDQAARALAAGDAATALRAARRAVALTKRRDAASLLALARAQGAGGDAADASETAEEALRLAPVDPAVTAELRRLAGPPATR